MNKNIWIINEYAGTPYHGMEFRHYYLGKELTKKGLHVDVISSSYSHLFKNLPSKSKENIDGVDFHWLKTFNYGSSHDKRRVLKWFLFTLKCFFLPFFMKNKPNVIIVSPMATFCILPAWVLAKIYKAKLVFEVKDIWPLSLVELGGYSPKHPFIRLVSWFERFGLKRADIIVSNLQNYSLHVKNLGLKRDAYWISNGVDLSELKTKESLDERVKKLIPNDKFIVGYAGTIGVANAIESFLASFEYVKNKDNICFVLVGNGQEKNTLQEKYESKNIIFIDAIAKNQIQSMLELFDVCFISWNNKKIYQYGTSANKLFDYMYSQRPVLNAFSGGGDMVKKAKCGLSVEAQNPQAIAKGIEKLYTMNKEERENLGKNGKDYVLKHFTYDKLAQKYIEILGE